MKKKNYWKAGICASLLLFAVASMTKVSAQAGAITEEDVLVDYVNETVTVNTNEDEIIYYTNNYYADLGRWDFCEVRDVDGDGDREAVFDISWINEEKTVRLYLCGDVQTDVVSVNLTWQENFGVKFVGTLRSTDITEVERWKETYEDYEKFSEDTGYLIFTVEENKRDNYYFDLENIEWRKGSTGVWRNFDELDLKEVNIRGIRLEFRIKANNDPKVDGAISTFSTLQDSGTRPSTIAKSTIVKLASAPEVNVIPDIMTLEVKNGQEFSLDKENWILIPTYSRKMGLEEYLIDDIDRDKAISPIYTNQRIMNLLVQKALGVDANTVMTEENLQTLGDFDFEFDEDGNAIGVIVYVREAGTEKKAASLVKEVIVPFAAEMLEEAKEEELAIYHGESKTGTGGIVCENMSVGTTMYPEGVKYQVAVLTPEEYAKYEAEDELENIDVSKLKWTSIKPGRILKFANKKIVEGSYLLYRIAGEEGKLPSTYLISEEIRYDQVTYAGFTAERKKVGEELKAVASTNVDPTTLTYRWQRCLATDVEENWEDIMIDDPDNEGEQKPIGGETYLITEEDVNYYIRVIISNATSEKASEPVGPIIAGK